MTEFFFDRPFEKLGEQFALIRQHSGLEITPLAETLQFPESLLIDIEEGVQRPPDDIEFFRKLLRLQNVREDEVAQLLISSTLGLGDVQRSYVFPGGRVDLSLDPRIYSGETMATILNQVVKPSLNELTTKLSAYVQENSRESSTFN